MSAVSNTPFAKTAEGIRLFREIQKLIGPDVDHVLPQKQRLEIRRNAMQALRKEFQK